MKAARDVEMRFGLRAPMRDGESLSATAYLPVDLTEPAPTIVSLTPYASDLFHQRGVEFASLGFPFVIVDLRGRGNSSGNFDMTLRGGLDGYDAIEWLAAQSFCNGRVLMWGGSFGGYAQWMTAAAHPPHLAAIVPAAATYRGVDSPMRNNIFFPERLQWLTLVAGRTAQSCAYSDQAFWTCAYRRWVESGLPFCQIDAFLGTKHDLLHEWLEHPHLDAYWDAQNPSVEGYAGIEIPTLSITGFFDANQPGALEHFRQVRAHAASKDHRLIIGPWDHDGTRTPAKSIGGITIGDAALIDLTALHVEWYKWAMGQGAKPAFLQKQIAYYVLGANVWHHADAFEEITRTEASWFLSSDGEANDVFQSGRLQAAPNRCERASASYAYDPRFPSTNELDAEEASVSAWFSEQRSVMTMSGCQLVFHTAPLTRRLNIAGFFKLLAWISIDCPDTDFYVTVSHIDSDGRSVRLTGDAMRARYRESLREPRLVHTTDPLPYTFNRFTFVAAEIPEGDRLRLVIAPVGHQIDAPFAERNFNGGGIVANERRENGRPVTVTLFHDRDHQSALIVPLADGGAAASLEI